MTVFLFLMLLLAVLCFAGATAKKSFGDLDLVALGLFFAFLGPLIQYFNKL